MTTKNIPMSNSESTLQPTLTTEGVNLSSESLTSQLEYASIRWFEKHNSKANRFVLQLRRHAVDTSLDLSRLLHVAAMKASSMWSDAD